MDLTFDELYGLEYYPLERPHIEGANLRVIFDPSIFFVFGNRLYAFKWGTGTLRKRLLRSASQCQVVHVAVSDADFYFIVAGPLLHLLIVCCELRSMKCNGY